MSEVLVKPVSHDWDLVTLGQLCQHGEGEIQTGPFGSQLHASDYVVSGIPSVMPQNIGDNFIIEDGIARISADDAFRLSRYLLKEGDIVYSRRGDVERRALVRSGQDGWLCGTGCLRVRVGTSADPRFVSYYLGHPAVRDWIVRHAVGATMPNLNTGILSRLPITLPPRRLQARIGDILEAFDDKIDANRRLSRVSADWAEARYMQLSSLPGSSSVGLGSLLDLKYGKSLPASARVSGRFPVFGSGGQVGTHEVALVPGPGVVVGRKGTVGAVYWSDGDFCPIDTTFYVQLNRPEIPIEWVYFALRNARFETMNSDSAVPGLNRNNALAVQMLIPRESELLRFQKEVRPGFELRRALNIESAALVDLRDAILPQLISGLIQLRNAEKIVEGLL